MDTLNNINVLISIITGCITIITTVASALSKSKSVQTRLQDASIPVNVRISLQDQWSGWGLFARMLNGIIRGGLAAVVSTLVAIFIVNFFFVFQTHIALMKEFSNAANSQDASNVFNAALTNFQQVLSFSNPVAITIGLIVGLLVGVSTGISTVTGGSRRERMYW
ncbi:hypothetical protein KDA_48620 [Dictyobacter alpinus]|uniref:Uncharacterized protein n=1 Tax=Dictyobacter alpinus TaxID=2014873 RepID=A0A402BD98_9CHLR|nr:hypothetical protein [Dictyobacter alpinus]GCE29378.1 hypothetical protein KDA_48620 [Dictyobacter alpinus]